MYGAEVWQIHNREIYKIVSTELCVLRRSARKSRVEGIEKWTYKGNNGSGRGAGHHRENGEERRGLLWYDHVRRTPQDRLTKSITDLMPREIR
jgi:hypothetical protein